MPDPVNLRRARKARARAEKATQAAENRALFGRTREERRSHAAATDQARRHLDGHQRDPAPAPVKPIDRKP